MNNDKSSPLIARYSYFLLFQSKEIGNPIKRNWKDSKSTKEKVSRPNPLNQNYINYSDIQIR